MHSKLMLLFHPDYVRVVVPTANLLPFDWGEQGGIMENVRIKPWILFMLTPAERIPHRPPEENWPRLD